MSDEQQWKSTADRAHPMMDDDGNATLAIAAGLVAALAGGAAWAAMVLWAQLEIGWAAWGVGAIVGLAMGRITANRGPKLGMAAAALAGAGLLVGKLMITIGSTGAIAEDIFQSPEYLESVMAWQMYEEGELDEATMTAVDSDFEELDSLSDAAWDEMRSQSAAKLAAMSDDERQGLARQYAGSIVGDLGILGAIRVQFSPWDLLWFGLALATAFRMLARREDEEEADLPDDDRAVA
jgi:hypothetical protein